MSERTCADDYAEAVPVYDRYEDAYRILAEGCEIPPSLEVFQHQLRAERQRTPSVTAVGLARRLATDYRRIR
jgi:hypothetical protein